MAYEAGGFSGLIDALILELAPNTGSWLIQWIAEADRAGIRLVVVRYEDMRADPQVFFETYVKRATLGLESMSRLPEILAQLRLTLS